MITSSSSHDLRRSGQALIVTDTAILAILASDVKFCGKDRVKRKGLQTECLYTATHALRTTLHVPQILFTLPQRDP